MTDDANPQAPRELSDEDLASVSGGAGSVPKELKSYMNLLTNPDVKRHINKEFYNGSVDEAYRHLYQALRLQDCIDQALQMKQIYADTHDGNKIPGLL